MNSNACYRYVAAKDTYDIKINREENFVKGLMYFNNYEKDDSKGTFEGQVLANGIIKTIYSFESEGMKSKREIFFLDGGDKLTEGIGDVNIKGNTAFLKNPVKISYTGTVYKKIDCAEIK